MSGDTVEYSNRQDVSKDVFKPNETRCAHICKRDKTIWDKSTIFTILQAVRKSPNDVLRNVAAHDIDLRLEDHRLKYRPCGHIKRDYLINSDM